MNITERLQAEAAAFGNEPLLVSPGSQIISLSKGYIPVLANFTFEDKSAKGLRKRGADDKPQPPVYFSALELVRDHKVLLLNGSTGSGKTTFAKHLAFNLATGGFAKCHPLVRNEEGEVHDEQWDTVNILPCYFTIDTRESLRLLIDNTLPELLEPFRGDGLERKPTRLIILDTIDKAGDDGPKLIAEILSLIDTFENIKLLLLGETSGVKHWILSPDVARHDLLPLLKLQRCLAVSSLTGADPSKVTIGTGTAASTPAYFALALEAGNRADQLEELLDAWLDLVALGKNASDILTARAFDRLCGRPLQLGSQKPLLASSKAVQRLLAARHLVNLPLETATELFHNQPVESEPVLRSLLSRLNTSGNAAGLVESLIRGSGTNAQLGALLVSDFTTESSMHREKISAQMLAIIQGDSTLEAVRREKAGRVLSRLGDPRDLTAFADIPAGSFVLGSECHPNSQPLETISLEGFRIGIYPVINGDYSIFVRESGREWKSPDGLSPERQNAPATDLSWHDATAYCEWLTHRWRSEGKISADKCIRLPTEPEWERASRGDSDVTQSPIYPWGTEWRHDAANYEESGFNTTCSVGLFPKGRSPYGCYDMSGNIWEWCTTLWGEDMTTPSFRYPWRNDEREALEAPGPVRRVLRGGCFSSGRLKVCCTYRGSLEPGGSWRGNGFRIVEAPAGLRIHEENI